MMSPMRPAFVVGLLLVPSALVGAADALPEPDDARKAVEARRGKTELSKLAAVMKPGTWAELKTEMPKELWISPRVDGGCAGPANLPWTFVNRRDHYNPTNAHAEVE